MQCKLKLPGVSGEPGLYNIVKDWTTTPIKPYTKQSSLSCFFKLIWNYIFQANLIKQNIVIQLEPTQNKIFNFDFLNGKI